ncbi:MAG TPA: Ldh family oxidoreductase [Bauldia sp.]|nr:Ldh family oxidoreductase [Bauldia sp.]
MSAAAAAELAPVRVDRGALAALSRALLEAAGASAENAGVVVEHLLEADAMGLKSHGIIRVPQYLADIAAGGIDPDASPTLTETAPGRMAVDGNSGFGQVVGVAMAREAARLAGKTGVAFVTGRHMGHTGRIGAYPEVIAAAGMVGIVVCSGPRHGHWVAPFGAREGRLATNPIAYAFPVGNGPPVVADFSTSVVPEGVVRSLKNRGLPAPEGALRDAAGNPTTDPSVLYAQPKGTIQALGGAFGYRGTALGILVDVLAALLAEDDADDPKRDGSNLAMIAIAANDAFAGRAGRMAKYIRSAAPLDPARPVMLPGEREQEEAARSANGPVLVDRPTWDSLASAAGAKGIPVPGVAGA